MKYEWSYFWLFVRHKPMPIFFNQRCKCFARLLARLHNVNCLYFIIVVDCCCTNFQYRTYLCISNLDVKVCLYLNTLKIYLVFASETLSTLSKNFFPSRDFFHPIWLPFKFSQIFLKPTYNGTFSQYCDCV